MQIGIKLKNKMRARFHILGVFLFFGLSGIIPAVHYLIKEGWIKSMTEASLQWLALMALLYVLGALLYAFRIPERYFPGKCDLLVSNFISVNDVLFKKKLEFFLQ